MEVELGRRDKEYWSSRVYEIPNSKHQITNKSQIPISKGGRLLQIPFNLVFNHNVHNILSGNDDLLAFCLYRDMH
jgi:hypothetical protein